MNKKKKKKKKEKRGWKKTCLHHIVSLTTDNTGSNTGINGVRGVLERERRLSWEEKKEGMYKPLFFSGCQDHIANLASTEFEQCLIDRTKYWKKDHFIDGKKHVSSSALCHIVSRIRSNVFHRAFKAYVRHCTGETATFSRFSETRYASINLLAIQYLKWESFIMRFFYTCKLLLTEMDIKYLKILVNPEIKAIIKIRALFGLKILFPIMSLAKDSSEGTSFLIKLENIKHAIQLIEQNPQSMSSQINEKNVKFVEANEREVENIESLEANKEPIEEQKQIETIKECLQLQFQQDEEEESEMIIEEEFQKITSFNLSSSVVIKKPSTYTISAPSNIEELKNILVVDAARCFLYQINKHMKYSNTNQISFFLPTSRSAERMFSFTKELLDRNKEMRIELINCILCLHDLSNRELTEIWQTYYDDNIHGETTRIIANCPKITMVDDYCLQKLKTKIEESEAKETETLKRNKVLEILKNKGILKGMKVI